MSNTYVNAPETVNYCPPCADVFGTIDDRCECFNSEAIAPSRGDFDLGFEICRYCQAERGVRERVGELAIEHIAGRVQRALTDVFLNSLRAADADLRARPEGGQGLA